MKLTSRIDSLMPVLLCFGPMFMLQGVWGGEKATGTFLIYSHAWSSVGAVMVAAALSVIYARQRDIIRRLNALDNRDAA